MFERLLMMVAAQAVMVAMPLVYEYVKLKRLRKVGKRK